MHDDLLLVSVFHHLQTWSTNLDGAQNPIRCQPDLTAEVGTGISTQTHGNRGRKNAGPAIQKSAGRRGSERHGTVSWCLVSSALGENVSAAGSASCRPVIYAGHLTLPALPGLEEFLIFV